MTKQLPPLIHSTCCSWLHGIGAFLYKREMYESTFVWPKHAFNSRTHTHTHIHTVFLCDPLIFCGCGEPFAPLQVFFILKVVLGFGPVWFFWWHQRQEVFHGLDDLSSKLMRVLKREKKWNYFYLHPRIIHNLYDFRFAAKHTMKI